MSSDDEIGGWCPLLLCGHTFDPQSTSFVSNFEMDRCCFMRTLMSYSGGSAADGGTVPQPDVATAAPAISTDGLTWTFHLRSGLRYAPPFEDTEIVAADFIRSLERAFTPASNDIPWAAGGGTIGFYWTDTYLATVIAGVADFTAGKADHVSGLEAPDPHTLVVHLLQPTGDLGSRLALPQLGPIPANPAHPDDPLGVAQGHDIDYGDVMVSSGPYMFEGSEHLTYRARPEDQLPPEGDGPDMATLVRNPRWSPQDDPIRRAWADRIELFPISSPREGETKLRTGALDVVLDWGAEAGTVTRWLDDPALRHRIEVSPADGEDFLVLNVAIPPLDDLHVRRAMALSVNRLAAASALEGDGRELGRRVLTHLALDSYEGNLLTLATNHPGSHPRGTRTPRPGRWRCPATTRTTTDGATPTLAPGSSCSSTGRMPRASLRRGSSPATSVRSALASTSRRSRASGCATPSDIPSCTRRSGSAAGPRTTPTPAPSSRPCSGATRSAGRT